LSPQPRRTSLPPLASARPWSSARSAWNVCAGEGQTLKRERARRRSRRAWGNRKNSGSVWRQMDPRCGRIARNAPSAESWISREAAHLRTRAAPETTPPHGARPSRVKRPAAHHTMSHSIGIVGTFRKRKQGEEKRKRMCLRPIARQTKFFVTTPTTQSGGVVSAHTTRSLVGRSGRTSRASRVVLPRRVAEARAMGLSFAVPSFQNF
jgi:hypothetical protein